MAKSKENELTKFLDALAHYEGAETKFAAVMPTLVDIAVAAGTDKAIGLIDETLKVHPELALVHARSIAGIHYKTLVRTVLPTVTFRNANEGYESRKAAYENRLVETFIFNPRWECDKAVADRYEDGPEAFIALEASAIMEAAMQHLCSCFYYGLTTAAAKPRHATAGDLKGFPGLHDAMGLVVGTDLIIDALGADASAGSSVFAIKTGPKDVQWVWGNGGQLEVEDPTVERILEPATAATTAKPFSAYCQEMLAYPGLQVGNRFCVGRVAELGSAASGATTLDDTDLAALISLFPTGSRPDMFLMSRRSQAQLRANRTATNPTGAPAPFPDEAYGVPIQITDSILDTEEIALI